MLLATSRDHYGLRSMREPRNSQQARQAYPSLPILAASALVVLALGMLIHHFRSSGSNSAPPIQQELLARAAKPNAGGRWIARSDPSGRRNAAAANRSSEARNDADPFRANDDTGAPGDAQRRERGNGLTLPNTGARGARAGSIMGRAADAPGIEVAATVPVRNTDGLPGARAGHNSETAGSVPARPGQSEEPALLLPGADMLNYDSGADTRFATNERFQVPETGSITGQAGTVSFQLEPGWSGDNQADASLVEIGDGRLLLRKNVSYLRLEMKDDTGAEISTGVSIADWQGEPHYVTTTWGNGTMFLYVDGKPVAQQPYSHSFDIPSGTPVYVGTGPQNWPVAPGSLSNLALSNEPLGPGEIADRAAQVLQTTN